jgi:integrase
MRGRNPLRDVLLFLPIYRHGLRAEEARLMRWSQFDLDNVGTKTLQSTGRRDRRTARTRSTAMRLPVCGDCGRSWPGHMCSSANTAARSVRRRLPELSAGLLWRPASTSMFTRTVAHPADHSLDRLATVRSASGVECLAVGRSETVAHHHSEFHQKIATRNAEAVNRKGRFRGQAQ